MKKLFMTHRLFLAGVKLYDNPQGFIIYGARYKNLKKGRFDSIITVLSAAAVLKCGIRDVLRNPAGPFLRYRDKKETYNGCGG